MRHFLNHGNEKFQQVLDSEIYVDKTGLIQHLNRWVGTEDRFVCVSRARRFGKSIAVKMLEAYYCKTCDSRAMFAPFEIAKDSSFEKHINQYNVIRFDVQSFLLQGQDHKQFIDRIGKEIGSELRQAWPNLPLEGLTLPDMLASISDNTGEKFVFIIDEWDAIFRNYPDDTVTQMEWIHFLRDMFKQANAAGYVALAYLTGILPMKKLKAQSSLNNFHSYSMVNAYMLSPYVGFTQKDVDDLCARYEMDRGKARSCWSALIIINARRMIA